MLDTRLPSTCCYYQRDKRAKAGNRPLKHCCVGNRGALDRKFLSLFYISVIDVYLTNRIEYIRKLLREVADFLKSLLSAIMPVVSIRIWGG